MAPLNGARPGRTTHWPHFSRRVSRDIESHGAAAETPEQAAPIVSATAADVLECINIHQHYRRAGRKKSVRPLEDLPELDEMTLYGVEASSRDSMSSIEANRLIAAVKRQDGPFFAPREPLGEVDPDGYGKLDAVGWKLLWCLVICDHDAEMVLAEYESKLFDAERLIGIQAALSSRLDRDSKKMDAENVELCWALVDYITAMVASIIVQESSNVEWQARCLADLARWSMKVKVLCENPKEYSERSLEAAKEMLQIEKVKRKGLLLGVQAPKRQEMSFVRKSVVANDNSPQPPQAHAPFTNYSQGAQTFDTEDDRLEAAYLLELYGMRRILTNIFMFMLSLFVSSEKSGLSDDSFEISVLVTQLGLQSSTAVLGQDRDGELAMSSSERVTWGAYTAFLKMVKATTAVRLAHGLDICREGADEAPQGTVNVSCRWEQNGTSQEVEPFDITSMDGIVSLMVPLACTQPYVITSFNDLARLFNAVSTNDDFLRPVPPVKFSALYVMRSRHYDVERDTMARADVSPGMDAQPDGIAPDTQPLSKCLLTRHVLACQEGLKEAPKLDAAIQRRHRAADWGSEQEVQKVLKRQHKLRRNIEETWTIDERSITIKCPRYVYAVAFLCVFLVGGGMAMGFTVEDHIKGVDPFNITVFCWALAAFILVVAKAYRVQDWPWRDYLRRRVVCRSLSELCSVTQTDPQDVLAYLLWHESSTILITRGPYNKLFDRRENDGFSIDEKIDLRTMLMAGVIVVKVVGPQGYALLCRRLRLGDRFRGLTQYHEADDDESSLAFVESMVKLTRCQDANLARMRLDWTRVLGIYNVPRREFR